MKTKVNKIKSKLAENKVPIGTWVQMASPEIVEVVGYQNYDFVIIDLEHGQFGYDSTPSMIRAAEAAGVTPVVRVPNKEEAMILKVLDAGAMGILVPGITNREQAEKVVQASKYYPSGTRGACPWTRATEYFCDDWNVYTRWSNSETSVWLLIEGVEGIQNFDDILEVPDIDGIVLGPFDLSQSLGIPSQLNHPLLIEKLNEIVSKARKKGVNVISVLLSELTEDEIQTSIRKWTEIGVNIFTVGGDRALLVNGYKGCLAAAREITN